MQTQTEYSKLEIQHSPRWLFLIAAILLLAAATRIIHSDGWPLWTDEGWSLWITAGHTPAAVLDQLSADRHPPLYFLLLGVWRAVAGDSRLALRLLSALCGVLATGITYRLGRDSFGRRTGAASALIFAALPLAVYYTQVVRHYSLLILLAGLSALLFTRALRRPTAARIGLYALSAAAVLYTEYSGVLLIGTQVVFGLLVWRGAWRDKARLLPGWIGAALLYLPWAYVILAYQGLDNVTRGVSAAPGTYATTPADLVALGGVLAGGQLALAGGLALLGGRRAMQSSQRRAGRLYLLLGGAGLLGLMILGNLVTGLLANRTVAFLTPLLAVLAGAGLARLECPARAVLAAALIGLFLAAPPLIQPHMASDLAATALAGQYTPGDPVILEMGWDDDAMGYELARALGPEAPLIRTLAWVDHTGNPEPVLPHVHAVLETHDRVWVVNWLSAPQVLPYLDDPASGFRRVITQATPTGDAYAAAFPADTTIEAVLFERLPTGETAIFGDLFSLHGARLPATAEPGETVHIDLWWSVLEPPPLDYSVGVFVLDSSGAVVAQHDGPPGGEPTTSWVEGDLHFDRHTLRLPPGLPLAEYPVGVVVYWYGDNVPLAVNGETTIMIGTLSPP